MNKKLIAVTALFLLIAVIAVYPFGDSISEAQFKYVGVKTCLGACHQTEDQGNQYSIWNNSKHSQAYKTLQSPEADQIAKDKGFTKPAAETPECLKCHVLGKDINPDELSPTFDITQGVQCESCHGPGSEYRRIIYMTDKQKAIDNGLIVPPPGEEFCNTCHNSDSPTYKKLNYFEVWFQIKHDKPKN